MPFLVPTVMNFHQKTSFIHTTSIPPSQNSPRWFGSFGELQQVIKLACHPVVNFGMTDDIGLVVLMLSFPFLVWGMDHRPDPLQEAPQASWITLIVEVGPWRLTLDKWILMLLFGIPQVRPDAPKVEQELLPARCYFCCHLLWTSCSPSFSFLSPARSSPGSSRNLFWVGISFGEGIKL